MFDAIIVGAGPVGCRVGEIVAKEGFKVLILEKHSEIGTPVQCAGLVSHRIFELSGASDDIVVNVVKKARFYYSNKNYLELKSKKPVYVINRKKFDKELSEKARTVGVKIKTSTKFENYKKERNCLMIKTTKGTLRTKLLIGTDGPNSTVARATGMKLPNNVLTGVQTTIKSNYDSNVVELWFGSKISPDFFGWVIPENKNWARFGLGSSTDVKERYKSFLKKRFGVPIKGKDVLAGVIRYGLIDESVTVRVMLAGDAASQVKPFSGGGLIYGLIGAKFAAEACIKSLEEGKYDYWFLKENYDDVWKEKLAWPIRKGLFLNELIHLFSDDQLSFLFSSMNTMKLTKLLEFTDVDLL